MSLPNPVPCRCGREPERNTTLLGYSYSLSCKCGTDETRHVSRCDDESKCVSNWDAIMEKPVPSQARRWYPPDDEPLRSGNPELDYVLRHGGHASGGAGCC